MISLLGFVAVSSAALDLSCSLRAHCGCSYRGSRLEYQAFLDQYPITKFGQRHVCDHYGPSGAVELPGLVRRFDWVVDFGPNPAEAEHVDFHGERNPRVVLAGPHAVEELLSLAREAGLELQRRGSGAAAPPPAVVFMGHSWQMSAAFGRSTDELRRTVARLRQYFDEIYYMGRDVNVSGVRTMPYGLSEHYLRRSAPGPALAAIAAARLDPVAKPRGILAAWGWSTKRNEFNAGLEEVVENSTSLMLTLEGSPWYSQQQRKDSIHWKGQVAKLVSRTAAEQWVATPAARLAGVDVRPVSPASWWEELSRYHFLLSPMGDEIQSPKTIEALLVLTVPVVQRGPYPLNDDLVALGFPLAVVDEWHELEPERLGRWWADFAPRLPRFRAHCLTTEAYWGLLVGQGGWPCT